ncbi:hypothetical protein KQI42_15720 [Tissierella sp. MSJ-40]|uniref:Uncharacterized protein n=1 Tax=Tissierella simiarum TaxID=2841534 RepID=A0ABS6EBB9_9FIRM|nr:hypothetical protein [Tissierella simiarum]MBU5439463.1 hypothetical protein [Tissierella simiarum]
MTYREGIELLIARYEKFLEEDRQKQTEYEEEDNSVLAAYVTGRADTLEPVIKNLKELIEGVNDEI